MSTTTTASQSAMENLNRRQRMTLAMDCYEDITKHPDCRGLAFISEDGSQDSDPVILVSSAVWNANKEATLAEELKKENEELKEAMTDQVNHLEKYGDMVKERYDKMVRNANKEATLAHLAKKENEKLKEELKAWESDEDVVMNGPGMFLYEETKKENEELRQFHEWNKIAALKLNDEKHLNDKLNKEIDELKKVIKELLSAGADAPSEL